MERQTLLQADYLDIIFNNRNKKYGSYQLRRHYARRVAISGTLLFLGVGILSGFTLVNHDREVSNTPSVIDRVVDLKDIRPINPPPLPPAPPTPPPPPPAPKPMKTDIFTKPDIIDDNLVKPDEQMTKVADLHNSQIGASRSPGDSTDVSIGDTKPVKNGKDIPTIAVDVKPTIVNWVEQPPKFDGDMDGYLSRNIRYPELAREGNIQGRVTIKFVVNEDGSVSDATVVRGIGGGCDEEALRIIRSMPKWKPGKQNGTPVKVYFMLPIAFVLN